MAKIAYISKQFRSKASDLIKLSNQIVAEYQEQGFGLTVRQLYYQLVARGHIPNKQSEYKRLSVTISDARLAGLVDWLAIEDRTRSESAPAAWESPEAIVSAVANQYRIDKWYDQEYRPQVWVEKEALSGVVSRVCRELNIPYLACRGYMSQSTIWLSAQSIKGQIQHGQTPLIIHLGDHDPSGIDMTRDNINRLELLAEATEGTGFHLHRIALNFDQIRKYDPPPNPTKITDSRAEAYIYTHGVESWELDALEPQVISNLVRDEVMKVRIKPLWDLAQERENRERAVLASISENIDVVRETLGV